MWRRLGVGAVAFVEVVVRLGCGRELGFAVFSR